MSDECTHRHLRHDPARRRAGPGLHDGRARQGHDGARARCARRRHHRSRLPDRLAGRRRSRPADLPRGAPAGDRRARPLPDAGHRGGGARARARRPQADPHLHRHLRSPSDPQAADHARGLPRGGRQRGAARAPVHRRCGVFGRGCDAQRPRLPVPRHRGGRPRGLRDGQPARHGRLRHAGRDPRASSRTSAPGSRTPTASSSARTATTISGWRSPTAWRRFRAACGRSSARSTASASAPATRRSRRSSWRSASGATASRIRPAFRRTALYETSQLLTRLTSEPVQANKAIVGRNAFAHEAGIHQDGVLKDPSTYEIMRPEDVGQPAARLVLGRHSGRHAVQQRCDALGLALTAAEIEHVYHAVISLGEHRKAIGDGDLRRIVERVRANGPSSPPHRKPSATDTALESRLQIQIADSDCTMRLQSAIAICNLNLQSTIDRMIPLRDVIPSRTTPYITVTIIVLNALAWLFEISIDASGDLPLFLQLYGVVPADFAPATLDHLDVPARQLDARDRQHVVPVDLRRQRRGPARARPLHRLLSAVRHRGGARPDRAGSDVDAADGRRERRDRRRDGRVLRALSAVARADARSRSSSSGRSSSCPRSSCSGSGS